MSFRLLKSVIFIFVILITKTGLAQGEASMLFLRIPPSPLLNGMGRVGTALPTTDVHGFYFNPAQLGYASQTTNLAFQFYPTKTEWLPQFNISDMTYNSYAMNLGYNIENIFPDFHFNVGLGYMIGEINHGEFIYMDEEGKRKSFESKEHFNEFGIALNTDYYFSLSAGVGYKKIDSKLSPHELVGIGKTYAFDIGFLVTVPVLQYFPNIQLNIENSENLFDAYFNISLGYAITNIGGKVSNTDYSQADAIPRTAQLGYSFSTGLNIRLNGVPFQVIGIDWSSEVNDLLVDRYMTPDSVSAFRYQGLLGDIRFWDHFVRGKSDDKVETHMGWQVHLLEFVRYTTGHFNGPGWEIIKTRGLGVEMSGFLKLLDAGFDSDISSISNHFNVQYFQSKYEVDTLDHPLNKTKYKGLSIVISGF